MSYKYLFAATSVVFLGGCFATLDLAKESSGLSGYNLSIAKLISERAAQRCTRYTYDQVTGQAMTGQVQLHQAAAVKRLYVSTGTGWYKAEVASSGVWDNVYHNDRTNKFVCGEKNWSNDPSLLSIAFTEVNPGQVATVRPQEATRSQEAVRPQESSPCITFRASQQMTCEQANAYDQEVEQRRRQKPQEYKRPAESRLIELKSLLDKGLITPEQFENKRKEIINSI